MQAHASDTQIPLVQLPLPKTAATINGPAIGICEQLNAEDAIEQMIQLHLNHLVQKTSLAYEQELALARLMLASPEKFVSYPCASILTPHEASAAREKELTIFAATSYTRSEKAGILAKLGTELAFRFNDVLAGEVALLADEMISNAHEHGPARKAGILVPVQAEGVRPAGGGLRPCHFRVAADAERLIVACIDSYGTLNVPAVMRRLRQTFAFGLGPMMNLGEGGAGVGLFNIFRSASAGYLAVIPGKSTVVCASLSLRGSSRRREDEIKNFHVIAQGDL